MTDEEIEALAIRAAKGNNGGEWATHYTDEQKAYWRQFVTDLGAQFYEAGRQAGIDEGIDIGEGRETIRATT